MLMYVALLNFKVCKFGLRKDGGCLFRKSTDRALMPSERRDRQDRQGFCNKDQVVERQKITVH